MHIVNECVCFQVLNWLNQSSERTVLVLKFGGQFKRQCLVPDKIFLRPLVHPINPINCKLSLRCMIILLIHRRQNAFKQLVQLLLHRPSKLTARLFYLLINVISTSIHFLQLP